ncbi:MAG: carbamoyl phosphate synthase small subunit [Clostridia bacterium]|nr:carbamoyl phosphate synthase small subunit [Clostridia bacterium]
MAKKGYLLLEDGSLYEGELRGAQKCAMAELVFNTSVVGYMETLTDPCYAGQIVVQTFPCIGNYGVIPREEGCPNPVLSGYVAREITDQPCNFRCTGKLDDYLKEYGVTALTGVDTRALTRKLRDKGVMNAAILTEKPENADEVVAQLKEMGFHPSVDAHTCKEVQLPRTKGMYNVVLWDLGARGNGQTEMEKRSCAVTCVPASYTAKDILSLNPDGVLISNGAGNPADNEEIVREIAMLCEEKLPVMGVGLGHQLLAMSQGCTTLKLQYGHRGGNQPVKDVITGLNYISSQNHGYAVDHTQLPENVILRFVNRNDGSCEGLDYSDMPAFSVQFQPEACGGPMDTRCIYDRFIALMGGNKECR